MDWVGNLTSQDVNQNFDHLNDVINSIMGEVAPKHTVKISPKRRFVEPWMSTSLERSANKKHTLYKRTLHVNCTQVDIINYKHIEMSTKEQHDEHKNSTTIRRPWNSRTTQRSCGNSLTMSYKKISLW